MPDAPTTPKRMSHGASGPKSFLRFLQSDWNISSLYSTQNAISSGRTMEAADSDEQGIEALTGQPVVPISLLEPGINKRCQGCLKRPYNKACYTNGLHVYLATAITIPQLEVQTSGDHTRCPLPPNSERSRHLVSSSCTAPDITRCLLRSPRTRSTSGAVVAISACSVLITTTASPPLNSAHHSAWCFAPEQYFYQCLTRVHY